MAIAGVAGNPAVSTIYSIGQCVVKSADQLQVSQAAPPSKAPPQIVLGDFTASPGQARGEA